MEHPRASTRREIETVRHMRRKAKTDTAAAIHGATKRVEATRKLLNALPRPTAREIP